MCLGGGDVAEGSHSRLSLERTSTDCMGGIDKGVTSVRSVVC
jgi:hypothetical protein